MEAHDGQGGQSSRRGGTHWPSMSASSLRIRASKSLTANMSSPVGKRDAAPAGAAPEMPMETIISALFLGIPFSGMSFRWRWAPSNNG